MSFICECQKPYMKKGEKIICVSEDCICICKFNPIDCRSKKCRCTCFKDTKLCRSMYHKCICNKDTEICKQNKHLCICSKIKVDDKVNKCKSEQHFLCICSVNFDLCKGSDYYYNSGHKCNCINGICKSMNHDCICQKEPWSCRSTNFDRHICSCLIVGSEHCKLAVGNHENNLVEEKIKKKKKRFIFF